MAQSIEKVANAFAANSNDEKTDHIPEMKEIKKGLDEKKKLIDDIKTILLKIVDK